MLEQKRPASAEPDVNDIKKEGGAGQHLDDDNVFPNRIKALEVCRFGFQYYQVQTTDPWYRRS